MSSLHSRLASVKARVEAACLACGRAVESVEILPISKRQPITLVEAVSACGFDTFGENYVQEGSEKALTLSHLNFVLTGPLQRNKAKVALQRFQQIMSVDRVDLLVRLRALADQLEVVCPIWIQLDLWEEVTKVGGCSQADLPDLLRAWGKDARLPLLGFMALPPLGLSGAFQQAAEQRDHYQQRLGRPLRLSMGMSDDLEEAIRAGSDQVRIGTALFGAR